MSDLTPTPQTDDLRQGIGGLDAPDESDYQAHEAGRNLPVSGGQQFEAELERAGQDTWLGNPFAKGSLARKWDLERLDAQGGEKIHPDELNKMYPEMDKPFEQPMTKASADYLATQTRQRHQLDYLINNGPQGPVYGFVSKLGAGLIAHALDPLETGATLATGGLLRLGQGALVARATMLGADSAFMGESALRTALSSDLTREVVTNTAVAGASEAAAYHQGNREQNPQTLEGAALNVASAAGGSALISAIPHVLGRILKANPRMAAAAERVSLSQFANDQHIDPSPILEDHARERSGALPPGVDSPYQYKPLSTNEAINGAELYHGSPSGAGDFTSAEKGVIDGRFGQGVELTDNPVVANGVAGSKWNNSDGTVFKVGVNDAKILDLSAEPSPELLKALIPDNFQEHLGNTEGMSLDKILDRLQQELQKRGASDQLDELQKRLRGMGYDGVRYEGGTPESPHNIIHMFDSEKIQARESMKPNSDLIPEMTPNEARALGEERNSYKNSPNYDADYEAQIHELSKIEAPKPLSELSDMKALDQQTSDLMEHMKEQGHFTPDQVKELDAIKESANTEAGKESLIRHAIICVGRAV